MSLTRTIYKTVLAFSLALVAVFTLALGAILYHTYEQDAQNTLIQRTHDVANQLRIPDDQRLDLLQEQIIPTARITLIASDGTVRYDSQIAAADLPNHSERPEIRAAIEAGDAVSNRYSDTLKTDTLYAAVRLDDGSVVRLAQTRHSLFSFMMDLSLPLILLLGIVALLCLFLTKWLTRRIMRPIEDIDLNHPQSNVLYEEMTPLLTRIDDQQKRMRVQNQELAHAETMRRDFSANVSHEMKTPLTVISGYAELLKEDMVRIEDRRRCAGMIYDEAQRMRALIDDVLTLSRIEEAVDAVSNDIPIDIRAIARTEVARLTSCAADCRVRLVITADTSGVCQQDNGVSSMKGVSAEQTAPVRLMGTQSLCAQMMHNLVENGIRYNHSGGTVRVSIVRTKNGCCKIAVGDTGMGIEPDQYDKIFERFYRVDTSHSKETGGTGLGLAIVKHAVKRQGGSIQIFSRVERGTVFVLTFPSLDDRRRVLQSASPPSKDEPTSIGGCSQ